MLTLKRLVIVEFGVLGIQSDFRQNSATKKCKREPNLHGCANFVLISRWQLFKTPMHMYLDSNASNSCLLITYVTKSISSRAYGLSSHNIHSSIRFHEQDYGPGEQALP